jgi:hypothetical protein
VRYINLQFFKGGSSVKEVDKREPKSNQLKAMDDAFYKVFGGIMQRYGGVSMPDINSFTPSTASTASNTLANRRYSGRDRDSYGGPAYSTRYDAIARNVSNSSPNVSGIANLGSNTGYLSRALDFADYQSELTNRNIENLLQTVPAYLTKADTTTDDAVALMKNTQDTSSKYYDNANDYLTKHMNFLDNGTDSGFENYLAGSERAIGNAYAQNVGTSLNDLAAKGILNSTVTNRALSNQQATTADAIAQNRNTAANTWLQNYLGGAEQSRGLAESSLNSGKTVYNDLLNAAGNYRQNYDSGINGFKTQADLIPQYYTNALSPLSSAYNFWDQSTKNWLANDKDYVATSSGK